MENKKFICIRCPRGCEIQTTLDGFEITSIKGNVCKLGADYVNTEINNPRRIISTIIKVKNGVMPLAPVWTDKPIPKNKIFELMDLLKKIEIDAPVKIDQIILKNIFNLDINIIASGKVDRI